MLETIPSPGDLPDPGIEPRFPTLKADALTSEPPGKPQKTRSNREPQFLDLKSLYLVFFFDISLSHPKSDHSSAFYLCHVILTKNEYT